MKSNSKALWNVASLSFRLAKQRKIEVRFMSESKKPPAEEEILSLTLSSLKMQHCNSCGKVSLSPENGFVCERCGGFGFVPPGNPKTLGDLKKTIENIDRWEKHPGDITDIKFETHPPIST